jgi:hypothetical protein
MAPQYTFEENVRYLAAMLITNGITIASSAGIPQTRENERALAIAFGICVKSCVFEYQLDEASFMKEAEEAYNKMMAEVAEFDAAKNDVTVH